LKQNFGEGAHDKFGTKIAKRILDKKFKSEVVTLLGFDVKLMSNQLTIY